jgi:hypothetical protein
LIIFIIFTVCNNYYDLIINNLKKIIFLFLIIAISLYINDFFGFFSLNKLEDKKNSLDYIFSENSHFAMSIVPVIFYLLFNQKQFSFSSMSGLIVTFFSLLNFYSTTLIVGLSLVLLFSIVFCFNEVLKRYVLIGAWIIVCISTVYLSKVNNMSQQKNFYNDEKFAFFLKPSNEDNLGAIKHLWPQLDFKNFENKYFYDKKCEELITYKNYSNAWKNQNENIGVFLTDNYICLPLKKPDKLDLIFNPTGNLSVEVFMTSFRVTIFSVKE